MHEITQNGAKISAIVQHHRESPLPTTLCIMVAPPPYISYAIESSGSSEAKDHGHHKTPTRVTLALPTYRRSSPWRITRAVVHQVLSSSIYVSNDLTICAHKSPSDRGFFDETVRSGLFFWEACFVPDRSYLNKRNKSKIAICHVCRASAWLTQEDYTGKVWLHVKESGMKTSRQS